jgi:hypothetical protein
MWNELLQEVVAELVMMLQKMPHKKRTCALSLVKKIGQPNFARFL